MIRHISTPIYRKDNGKNNKKKASPQDEALNPFSTYLA